MKQRKKNAYREKKLQSEKKHDKLSAKKRMMKKSSAMHRYLCVYEKKVNV